MNILEAIKSGREIQTRNGYSVKILTTEAKSEYPIVGLIFDGLHDLSIAWDEYGISSALNTREFDLIFKSKKITKWINVYKNKYAEIKTGEHIYDSKHKAVIAGKQWSSDYLCTTSIEIEL